jgi:glucose/arabinose dehydrogenase
LSLALHPNFSQNGLLFVYYTAIGGETVLKRFRLLPDLTPLLDSGRVLLRIPQPGPTHNGGQLQFGPDGYLYLSTGDGEYRPSWLGANGYAQDKTLLLGKLLRLDVSTLDVSLTAEGYRIPPDNPFVGLPLAAGDAKAEVWALGLRNPWRFSFDAQTGEMFVTDVGETRFEEVNVQRAKEGGQNYGWPHAEGSECRTEGSCRAFVAPALVYTHGEGCSVTGGYVYRGEALPQLQGRYLYADFCTGQVWAARETERGWEATPLFGTGAMISTFGEGENGELFLADYAAGAIYKIVSDVTASAK